MSRERTLNKDGWNAINVVVSHEIYRFGPFAFDRASYRLLHADRPVALAPKVLDLLALFVVRPAELVTKAEILRVVWQDIAVTDNALTQAVSDLRQALQDEASRPRYIQTVPRRGYRFIAGVDVQSAISLVATTPMTGERGDAGRQKRTIAVSDFTNVTGDAEVAWMAAGIAETVTNDLRALRDLRLIDRATLGDGVRRASVAAARAAGLDLLVVGSYQRAGAQLRITARALDASMGEAVAHAKADGPVTDVFRLQDAIVHQLLPALDVPVTPAAAARIRVRETSSLEAYRALTEGRLKLETMNPADVPAAMAEFDRAIAVDAEYALAYVGRAHARFWLYETSRWRNRPDAEQLAAAIADARKAIALDPELAEANAALALLLVSGGRQLEARDAGRRAVALEPNDWRHRFRLGVAAWGDERLACFDEVVDDYPGLGYAYFGSAMVHVARRDLDAAEDVVRQGLAVEARLGVRPQRFPSNGLHWLLGLVRLSRGDVGGARLEFERELSARGSALYAAEYAMDAYDGLGYAALAAGDAVAAHAMFARALEVSPDHARSLIGLAATASPRDGGAVRDAMGHAWRSIAELRQSGRTVEAAVTQSLWLTQDGQLDAAVRTLADLLDTAPPGFAGWTIPIEPLLAPLHALPSFAAVLALLATRAS